MMQDLQEMDWTGILLILLLVVRTSNTLHMTHMTHTTYFAVTLGSAFGTGKPHDS